MKTLVLSLFSCGALALTAHEAQAACGLVESSKGDVKIQSGKQLQPAAVGAKICSGDAIVAGKDSRAKLKMEDGNELNVSPDSRIVLETYQYNAAENRKKVLLNVLSGKVRATTKQENMYNDKAKDGADNSFQVRTKSAVAGVRGTDFLTTYDPKSNKSEVVTFRGKVEFGKPGPAGQILGAVQVTAGQKTELVAGQPPAPPKVIPPRELQQMNTETRTDSSAAPSSGADAKSDKKSDKKDDDRKDDKRVDARAAAPVGATDDKRGPASASPSSMLTGDETKGGTPLPTATGPSRDIRSMIPTVPTVTVPTTPICEQCNDAIAKNSPLRLKVIVNVK